MTNQDLNQIVTEMASALLYTKDEIEAGLMFSSRKARRSNPPGKFDSAGRFYASEKTESVKSCRTPSRAFPHSEMKTARTANHCAEVCNNALPINVKRIAKLRDQLEKYKQSSTRISAHNQLEIINELKLAKPQKRK